MNQLLNQTSLLVLACIFEKTEPLLNRILARLASDISSEWSTERAPLNLRKIYSVRPQPGGNQPLRAVMWTPSTLPDKTAFYINSESGWSHFWGKLSQAGGPEMVAIRSSLPEEKWGIQEIAYRRADAKQYRPTRMLQWLEEEDGYRLVKIGEALPFEQNTLKQSNPIATRHDLLTFVRNFGIDLEVDEFWNSDSDAVYLSQKWLNVALNDESHIA